MSKNEVGAYKQSNHVAMRALISGLKGWQIVLVSSLALAVAFAFTSLSSSFSSLLLLASQGKNLSYEIPIYSEADGLDSFSLFCIQSQKNGVYLPDYLKQVAINSTTITIRFNNETVETKLLGFTGSNASYGYLLGNFCKPLFYMLNPEKQISSSLIKEVNRISVFWIFVSIALAFISTVMMVFKRSESLRASIEYLIHSGATDKEIIAELFKTSFVISFLASLFGLGAGLFVLRLSSYIISFITGVVLLSPTLEPEQTIVMLLTSLLAILLGIVIPSYRLAFYAREAR